MLVRRLACAAALAVVAPLTVTATGASAANHHPHPSRVTVHVTDRAPASHQTFIVHGVMFWHNHRAANHTVKLQTRRGGEWHNIRGAHMRTNSRGHYRLRLVLFQRGHRVLRAVGVVRGPAPNVFNRFTVRVH
ncbi:MAG: hypothetical protein ACRDQA_11955 [Nocardioidaceae bacterium]